ncbi:MAG: 5'-3' exonuclease H3TH domain-containing protein [Pseudomonadota bacterium]
MDNHRVWLIDGSIYIFRAWFAMPDHWYTKSGRPVQAVYGYTRFLLDLLDSVGTEIYAAVAFDQSLGTNFRNDIYPDYKVSRELPDEDLAFQLEACRSVTEMMGFKCFAGPRFEADDYLASLAKLARDKGFAVTVVTRDKDLGQLVLGEADEWWDFASGQRLDRNALFEKFGVWPEQMADYLALVGDPVDDVPGVPGVGPKTASTLLRAFGDLSGLHTSLPEVAGLSLRGAAGLAAKLENHWPQVSLSRRLTGLEQNVPAIKRLTSVPGLSVRAECLEALSAFLSELNIGGPLRRRCEKMALELAAT